MQAELLSQAYLASGSPVSLQILRCASPQNLVQFCGIFPTQPICRWGCTLYSRRVRVVRSAQRDDFADVDEEVKYSVPSVLKLRKESRVVDASTDVRDNSKEPRDLERAGTVRVELGDLQKIGTVREVIQAATQAVGDAPVRSVGQAALFGGMAAFVLLLSGAILNSVDHLPFAPEALQTIGVAYSFYIVSQVVRSRPVSFAPPSPFQAVINMVDSGQVKDVSKGAATIVKNLTKERNIAVDQADDLRRAAQKIATIVAEKEALEAVSLQLADERDSAIYEVSAMKDAIVAMTNRIKAIEEMVEEEVSQLKQQNQALETVSLQLAAERDAAIQEIEQLQSNAESWRSEKEALEVVASELAQERDAALAEIEDLKKVVALLRESASTSSGLTPEQEIFIKSRVREIRSQFIDVEHVYEDQKDKVDSFVEHLVQEYGVPHDWTADYIKQFLKSSASKLNPPKLNVSKNHIESLTGNTSRT